MVRGWIIAPARRSHARRGARWVVPLWLLLVVGAGCQPPGQPCVTSFDCLADETCVDKTCRWVCNSTADCPADQRCEQGVCMPTGAVCREELDCLSTETCREGVCRRSCTGTANCASGSSCVQGACLPGVDAAVADAAAGESGLADRHTRDRIDAGVAPDVTAADVIAVDGAAFDLAVADVIAIDGAAFDVATPDVAAPDRTAGDGTSGDLVAVDVPLADAASADATVAPIEVAVAPVYPTHAEWNSYVKNDEPGADPFHQDDVSCEGDEEGPSAACIHGGEKRKVELPTESTCAGLTLSEELGLFDWICQDNLGRGPVTFYTAGLSAGRGLRHVVDGAGFRANAVTVARAGGAVVAQSPAAVWGWSNPVVSLPDNSAGGVVSLDSAGSIYTFAGDRTTDGYNLDADRVAVVSLDSGALVFGASEDDNCRAATGETGTGSQCLLAAGGQRFLWIETGLDEGGSGTLDYLALLAQVAFSRVHDVAARGGRFGLQLEEAHANRVTGFTSVDADSRCVALDASHRNTLVDISCADSWNGLALSSADHNLLERVVSADNTNDGINLYRSSHNRLWQIAAINNHSHGVVVSDGDSAFGSRYNILTDLVIAQTEKSGEYDGYGLLVSRSGLSNTITRVLSVGNQSAGVWIGNSSLGTTISHATIANNDAYGLAFGNGMRFGTAVQVLTANNNGMGVACYSNPSDDLFSHIFAAHNDKAGVSVQGAANMTFTGHLWFGNNGWNPCYVDTPGEHPGLVGGSCTLSGTEDSFDYPEGETSNAVLHVDRDLTGALMGPVTDDDAANASDALGRCAYDEIADWDSYDNRLRAWGKNGDYFPGAGARSRCAVGETCRILDWRLRAADTQVLNINGWFVAGAACPDEADGDKALDDRAAIPFYEGISAVENTGDDLGDDDGVCEDAEECHNRFLVNALEVMGDQIGDEDGLCESTEACVFSPNIGAYQGEGDCTADTCDFVDGKVHSVIMFGCPQNGALW